jgi:hypothetical protein
MPHRHCSLPLNYMHSEWMGAGFFHHHEPSPSRHTGLKARPCIPAGLCLSLLLFPPARAEPPLACGTQGRRIPAGLALTLLLLRGSSTHHTWPPRFSPRHVQRPDSPHTPGSRCTRSQLQTGFPRRTHLVGSVQIVHKHRSPVSHTHILRSHSTGATVNCGSQWHVYENENFYFST